MINNQLNIIIISLSNTLLELTTDSRFQNKNKKDMIKYKAKTKHCQNIKRDKTKRKKEKKD